MSIGFVCLSARSKLLAASSRGEGIRIKALCHVYVCVAGGVTFRARLHHVVVLFAGETRSLKF